MLPRPYSELLRHARRAARRADEAEDLLQTVLLAAVEAGRTDLGCPENRRWLHGALRKRAAFDARTTVRRRVRETHWSASPPLQAEVEPAPRTFVATLPPSLRTTALLVLTGHTRHEIAWLQALSEPAFRQRVADSRRRWRIFGSGDGRDMTGLAGGLSFGRIRQALLPLPKRRETVLASHDPDGHLFVIARSSRDRSSQNPPARQQGPGATQKE